MLHLRPIIAAASLLLSPFAFGAKPDTQPSSREADMQIENLDSSNGSFTLKRGPNCEGIVYMWGGHFEESAKVFHETPWIDSATITRGWETAEPEDQKFDFTIYDQVLAEVRKYNEEHPGANRTMHIRMVGGRYSPKWLEEKGVKFYDTTSSVTGGKPIHIPTPYDNPEMMKQVRELYRATYEHFKDAPEVICYHGTWSGGPWEEIFHPREGETLPPNYTREKYMKGMVEQLDILIDEYCMNKKAAEISFSGLYPKKDEFDITGPLAMHMVRRLGKRSPYLYVNSDGWGYFGDRHRVSAGHERDMFDILGLVNVSLQAYGDNYGTKPGRQGDWPTLVKIAQDYDASYLEIYASDAKNLDTKHRIVEAFEQTEEEASSGKPGAIPDFIGFRPWLKKRDLHLYDRDGFVRQVIKTDKPMFLEKVELKADTPLGTYVIVKARTRNSGGEWTEWLDSWKSYQLPAGTEIEIEANLHTDDGYFTPTFHSMKPILSETKVPAPLDEAPLAVAKRNAAATQATQPAE